MRAAMATAKNFIVLMEIKEKPKPLVVVY